MVLCYIKSSYAKSDLTIELALLKVVQDGLHSLALIAQTTLIKINENWGYIKPIANILDMAISSLMLDSKDAWNGLEGNISCIVVYLYFSSHQ